MKTDRSLLALHVPGGPGVVFQRHGDRYVHSFHLTGSSARLVSVEGNPSDLWPPHPPIQQLAREERPAGPVLLGLGMAGRSHWSLAVSLTETSILFEVACRVRGVPAFLGSTYRLAPEAGSTSTGGRLDASFPGGTIRFTAGDGTRIETRSGGPGHASSTLVVLLPSGGGPTVCWRYMLSGPVAPGPHPRPG